MIESKVRKSQKEAAGTEILVAAEELLLNSGAHAVNMAAIARRAGIAVGTLYNYFSDKENLLKSLLETRRLEMHASLDRELEPVAAESFATKLRTVLRYAFNDEPMRVRFRNLMRVSFDELGASASDSMLTVFAQRLEPVLESGIKDGSLRECCKEMQSLILVSIIKIVMDQKTAGNVTNEQAIEIVFSSFMQGHGAK